MNWERRNSHSTLIEGGLTTEAIRDGLFRGSFTPEDWVRRTGDREWHQLVTIDEFAGCVTGSRRRRIRPAEEDDALDMTPMIDCTFLLLIFFMITASFHLQKGLDFPPDQTQTPTQESSPDLLPGLEQFTDRLIVEISEGDQLTLKTSPNEGTPGEPIQPGELVATLRRLARDTKKTSVLIVAHELASHESVVLVIDSCGQAGIKEVSLGDAVSQRLPGSPSGGIRRE